MSLSNKKQKDAAMASYMKDHPSQFPDSCRRPHNGCGADDRIAAGRLGASWRGRYSSTFEKGMLGGVLAHKIGFALPTNFQ